MIGEERFANIIMDSIVMSVAVLGVCVKMYNMCSETGAAVVLFFPQPL